MHSLKPFTFILNLLLWLLSLSSQKPLVDADIQQVTLRDQSSLSLNNSSSVASESDEEEICSIEANITASSKTYLMKFGLQTYEGETDYRYVNATLDTGSNFTWFHSKPCKCILDDDCDSSLNILKPNETFRCEEPECETLKDIRLNHKCIRQKNKNLCWYGGIKYGDGTESNGYYSKSSFTFANGKSDKTDSIYYRKLKVGFSATMTDEDVPERNGLVGLARGKQSFINQYGGINKKFSYYLPQFRRKDEQVMIDRSKFKFGCKVKITDKHTRLLKQDNKYKMCGTHYCVQLKSICLKFKGNNCENDDKMKVSKDDTDDDKVIIIDSGSTFTYLQNNIFQQFLGKVKEKLDDKSPIPILYYKNCFEKKDENIEKLEKLSLEFEFGGTTIELKRENFFDEYNASNCNGGDLKTFFCLTVEGQTNNEGYHKRLRSYGLSKVEEPQLLGSRAQMDFLVAFNLGNRKKVSFENLEKLPDHGSVEKVSFENNEKVSVLSE